MKFVDFKELFDLEGSIVGENPPQWAEVREEMRKTMFPSVYKGVAEDPFAEKVKYAMEVMDQLKHHKPGPGFLGKEPYREEGPDYETAKKARIAPERMGMEQIVEESAKLFNGMPDWNHPMVMPNVIPPANIGAILASMMTEVFSPNIIEGEYSWNVEYSELESAAIVADLLGWDPDKAGGLFTFGGSGCYFYGMKYALTRVLGKQSRLTGIRTDGKVLVSQQGHYCKQNSTDWSGLGMNNIIDIETDTKTNAMDVVKLEEEMADLYYKKIPIISIICTMGSTDAFAVDPVKKIRELIEKYPNPPGYGKTFLYCDSVIGWSWLTFKGYDFEANPLGFSPDVNQVLRDNYEAIKDMKYADAIGCDFHKVGWAPYNCSLFAFQDNADFENLMKRPSSDYLQERTTYNPGLYTLEVSRSGSYSMAGWATLKGMGSEGFRVMLGGILEVQQSLRDCLEEQENMVCTNSLDEGFVTLYRVYPPGIDAAAQYKRELNYPDYREQLIRHNRFQQETADLMWEWFRQRKELDGGFTPYTSYSSGFRPTTYNREETDPHAVIYALKSFPMNININRESMDVLVKTTQEAARQIWKKWQEEDPEK